MKVLILGHKGMLGHMVKKFLHGKCEIVHTNARFPSDEFKDTIKAFDGNYIINCVGAIPQRTKIFDINYELPIWLCSNTNARIIHPGTDCEMDNDGYGISKKAASNYIKLNSNNTKIIKTSIIGPEINTTYSLLSWFLSSNGSVNGYKNAYWNGVTTLEWAKICYNIMCNWEQAGVESVVQSNCISKYELLCIIRDVYKKNININLFENDYVDKCLNGNIFTKNIKEQLQELKEYYTSISANENNNTN